MILALLLFALHPTSTPREDPTEQVRKLAREWKRDDGPGGVIGVVRDGEVLLTESFGLADLASKRPVTATTPFYVASLAKPFTAACAVHAAASGAFELDAPVTKLFPELPESYGAATVRQLLHHRSGIPDVYDAVVAADLGIEPVRSNASAIALLTHLPQLTFTPGTRMLYSNSGYVLLAEAIARSTGRDLPAYAREHVFEPLGMNHARYLGDAQLGDVAHAYAFADGQWTEQPVRTGLRGPGGLYLALDDLLRFERAWARGEWGTPGLRAALLDAPKGWHNPRLGCYVAGTMLQTLDGLRVERESGGAFGFSADVRRFPDQHVSVVVLSNAGDLDAATLCESVARVVLAKELASAKHESPRAIELSKEASARFGRIWRDARSGQVWIVTSKPDCFVLATLGDIKLELVAESDKRLVARNAQVPFAVELDDGKLVVRNADESSELLEAVPFPPRDLPPIDDYVGEYTNAELGATIRFEARGSQLALVQHDPLLSVPPFLALARDLYMCDKGAQIDFRRDAENRVRGLTIVANRSGPLRFERKAD